MPATKKKGVSKKKLEQKVEEVIEDEVIEVIEEVIEEEVVETTPSTKKPRKTVTKEDYIQMIDDLSELILAEVSNMKDKSHKTTGVKFLKGLNTKLSAIKKVSSKLLKTKTKRQGTVQSGFLKPVPISDELRKFAGWEKDDLHSRVDVTKFICQYIKDKDLQNPDDRRQIIPDKDLKKILGLKSTKDPLHYYNIQTHIKHHFN